MSNKTLLLCYNRGCGQQYDPSENHPDSCKHHSGYPVFHDAYKGWSCCKKKCTDFTEFLNIKGCTESYHSNVKPPETPKPVEDKSNDDKIIEFKPPKRNVIALVRPPFESPLITLKIQVTASLKEQLLNLRSVQEGVDVSNGSSDDDIAIGSQCKNNSCKMSYEGQNTLSTLCHYHPGFPIFHEGLKFWSCCTKRTTDFEVFLNQIGCTTGEHVFKKEKVSAEVKCRLDWHQTGSHVYVTIFGKKCDPSSSKVQLSPIRLKMSLLFPEQGGSYIEDMELGGIVSVEESSVIMTPTKVEIKLRKKETGSWSKLMFPRKREPTDNGIQDEQPETVSSITSQVENVDLSCI